MHVVRDIQYMSDKIRLANKNHLALYWSCSNGISGRLTQHTHVPERNVHIYSAHDFGCGCSCSTTPTDLRACIMNHILSEICLRSLHTADLGEETSRDQLT